MRSNPVSGTWLQDVFKVWILCHRCDPHSEFRPETFLSHLVHPVSSLRCDAADIDQGCDCRTTVHHYEGRMLANPVGGTWLQGVFKVWILCHGCDQYSEKRSASFMPHIVHSVSCLRCSALDIDQGRNCARTVYYYEGRMPSNSIGGTSLQGAFTIGILCQR
jgi:hypothetical protein